VCDGKVNNIAKYDISGTLMRWCTSVMSALVLVALLAAADAANEFLMLTGPCEVRNNGSCVSSPGYPTPQSTEHATEGCSFAVQNDVWSLTLNTKWTWATPQHHESSMNTLTLDPADTTAAIIQTARGGDVVYWIPRTNNNDGFELCEGALARLHVMLALLALTLPACMR
jgi:hypothetical protein